MVVQPVRSDALQARAPNGTLWTRRPDGRGSAGDLLRELTDLGKNHIEREWDWWEDGRRDKEHDRQWAVLAEWDNGAKDPPDFDPEAASKRREVHATLRQINFDFQKFQFNTCVSGAMKILNAIQNPLGH